MNTAVTNPEWNESAGALHRAQMSVSTAVFFEDVAASVLAGGVSLANAHGGALWLRNPGFFRGENLQLQAAHSGWVRVLHIDCEHGPEGELPPAMVRMAEHAEVVALEGHLAFPFLLNGNLLGGLQLCLDSELEPLAQESLLLFCEHAAVELANARLFELMENAKREWETTFDGMIYGVFVEDSNGVVRRANEAAAEFLDVPINKVAGMQRSDWPRLLNNYEQLRPVEPVANDPTARGVSYGELRCQNPARIFSETVFELRLSPEERRRARPLLALPADDRRYLRVVRDITEQRRLEEQLIQSEKLAALGELVSGVAHELNNPLTTVTGYAQLLQDDMNLPQSARRQISHIFEEASRAARIVGNLLAFARREEPRQEMLDIHEVLHTVVEMRSYQMNAHNIAIEEHYSDSVPPVRGDSHQLQQVFLNIINNAQGAMTQWRGGGVLTIRTQPAEVRGELGVIITFTDNGPGIAPDHLRRIFDPFFTTKPTGEGTGLGMSISLGIITNHNGRIWAESTLGSGATFFVELPGAIGEVYEKPPVEEEPKLPTHPAREGKRILVIDDEEPVSMLIQEVLALDSHETTAAFNGSEALALLQERDFDLILSDVRMPAVGGPTFFEILQTTRPDLLPRVIFVTGDTMSPSTQEFLRRAARPVIPKPFDPERLRQLVHDQLQQNKG